MLEFVARLKAYDSVSARDLIENVDVHCPPENRIAARSHLGFLVGRLAQQQQRNGAPASDILSEAAPYLTYSDHWELRRTLGELSMSVKEYDEATKHFFRALELIEDVGYTPKAPTEADTQKVYAMASEAMALSRIPAPTTTRGGATVAYFAPSVRGIAVPKKTPQITFVSGTADFDTNGAQTVAQLAPILKRESPDRLTLFGHTDERGADDYNEELSRTRVQRVKAYLEQQGFQGTIQVRWCGEAVPVQVVNPDRFSQDELWQINRRVEVFYGQGGEDGARYGICKG